MSKGSPITAAPGDGRHFELAAIQPRTIVAVPAYGYLLSVEIKFHAPIPNMMVSDPLRLIVEPLWTPTPAFSALCEFAKVVHE